MSSNLSVQRVCLHCGQTFTAKTTFTKYCSHKCNSQHYKKIVRDERIQVSQSIAINIAQVSNVQHAVVSPLPSDPDYMSITEAASKMRVSRRTIFRLIALRKLKCKKVMSRTLILKEDIKIFFAYQ